MKKIILIFLIVMLLLNLRSQTLDNRFPEFLIKAKKECYASGDKSKIVKLPGAGNEITYQANDFSYKDRYYGEYNFSGEEIVWLKNNPVWSMNYYGITYRQEKTPEGFAEFLHKSLSKVTVGAPYRGPEYFKDNDFEYFNSVEGSIEDFRGVERIVYKGEEIYKLYYHGGSIIL
jgi:CRISPR/Cas system CSM-associated protein Csm2 small subunit